MLINIVYLKKSWYKVTKKDKKKLCKKKRKWTKQKNSNNLLKKLSIDEKNLGEKQREHIFLRNIVKNDS